MRPRNSKVSIQKVVQLGWAHRPAYLQHPSLSVGSQNIFNPTISDDVSILLDLCLSKCGLRTIGVSQVSFRKPMISFPPTYLDKQMQGNQRILKIQCMGQPRWPSGLAPPSAQGVILETWDRVPRRVPCVGPASPSACVSASLCVSLMNK